MAPLRHTLARFVQFGERIALDYRDLIVVIGERARCQYASHARADHDRMTTEMCHDTGFLFVRHLPSWQDTGGRGFGFAIVPVDGFSVSVRSASRLHFSVNTSPRLALRPNAFILSAIFTWPQY
jgi:hypothetical protein